MNPGMLIPYNIEDFLSVGENKEIIFGLIQRSIEECVPSNRIIYFCFRNCTRITAHGSQIDESLRCDHEKADTKLVAYAHKSSAFSNGIVVRSASADIDIAVLLSCHQFRCKLFLDNGSQKNRRIFDLNDIAIPEKNKAALIGVHAFSGNDYVSCFFRKGKKTCWNTCLKSDLFISVFENLGASLLVSDEVEKSLGKYVGALYSQKKAKDTNEARGNIFCDRYNKKGKICELSMLPPCVGNLLFHIKRSNYVAYIYRHATPLMLNLPNIEEHGWNAQAESLWMEKCLPEEYNDLMLDSATVDEDDNDEEDEIDDYEDDIDIDALDLDF